MVRLHRYNEGGVRSGFKKSEVVNQKRLFKIKGRKRPRIFEVGTKDEDHSIKTKRVWSKRSSLFFNWRLYETNTRFHSPLQKIPRDDSKLSGLKSTLQSQRLKPAKGKKQRRSISYKPLFVVLRPYFTSGVLRVDAKRAGIKWTNKISQISSLRIVEVKISKILHIYFKPSYSSNI